MSSKNIIHESFFCLIFISIFSCGDDKLNSADTNQQTNNDSAKRTLRNSIVDSDAIASLNPIPEKKLILRIDGELMDCDGSTVELSCCTAYIADSLSIVLEDLYDSLITDSNLEIASTKEYLATLPDDDNDGGRDYLKNTITNIENIRDGLIVSQKYFYKYLNAELKLVESAHDGNGRIMHQDRIEVELLEERIADLKELFWIE